jgi:glycosyltransferase involved in cell wall biosynthesis
MLPSSSANSVHVVMQVRGLADVGLRTTLYACRSVDDADSVPLAVREQYGVDTEDIEFVTVSAGSGRGVSLRIALRAFWAILGANRDDRVISRNLYAAYLLGVIMRRPLTYETHDIESGVRAYLQRACLRCPRISVVVISQRLLRCLSDQFRVLPRAWRVLHDAAPEGIVPISPEDRRRVLFETLPEVKAVDWKAVCGYFGHLYAGRGIEIIEAMAARLPEVLFLVAGGREKDVTFRRQKNKSTNLKFLGHLPHPLVIRLAKSTDVLLMPYQASVSIGTKGRDTARWMSPMKMFEYMATGVPIIASDLPALKEVLHHGENAMLVTPDDVDAWIAALCCLLEHKSMAVGMGQRAHVQYRQEHTWTKRARSLLEMTGTA